MKQLFDVVGKFFAALTAKDYVAVSIIIALTVAYFGRSDKQAAEEAARIAQEICRLDRIRSDSAWQARFDQRDAFWEAKFERRTQEYINSLRGITDTVQLAVGGIKRAVVERNLTRNEVNQKVNRNGRELEAIKKERAQ